MSAGWEAATTAEQDDARRMLAAVLQSAYGDVQPALAELHVRSERAGEQGVFSALYGITKPALDILGADVPGTFVVACGEEQSVDDVEPGLRAGVRFLAAVGNDDGATALALMRALPDDRSCQQFLALVVRSAGTLWRHIAETRDLSGSR